MMVFTIDQVVGIVLLTIGIMILLAFFVLMKIVSKREEKIRRQSLQIKYLKSERDKLTDLWIEVKSERDALSEALDQERAWNDMRD